MRERRYRTDRLAVQMSVHVMSWAWRQDVSDPAAKLVLLRLADTANDEGETLVTWKSLQESVGVSRPTIHRKLRALQDAELIHVKKRTAESGARSENMYTVLGEGRAPQSQSETGPVSKTPVSRQDLVLDLDLPEGSKDIVTKQNRARDMSFEAIVDVTNFRPETGRSRINAALRQIRVLGAAEWDGVVADQAPNADPAPPDAHSVAAGSEGDEWLSGEIRRRGGHLKAKWGDRGQLTPQSLAAHWAVAGAELEDQGDVFDAIGFDAADFR